MDFVKQIVAQVVGPSDTTSWSASCLATTNPVYLIFSCKTGVPAYVVRVTTSTQHCTHEVGVLLHQAAGTLVPEPIGLVHQDGKRFSIQKGVPGSPWFQIAHKYSEPKRWDALRTMAMDTLKQFHERIRHGMPHEKKLIHPAQELLTAHDRFLKIHGDEPEGLTRRVKTYEEALKGIGQIEGLPQHGDFSLNNLIICEHPGHVTVIDFEDFNITQMPLYDEFTLALSLYTAAPRGTNSELHAELSACRQIGSEQAHYEQCVIEALFLYHLLTRLGQWSMGLKRKPYRQWLLSLLEQFNDCPKALFPG